MDRTQAKYADSPLHKLLNINNFGVYFKNGEKYLIQKFAPDEQLSRMQQMSSECTKNGCLAAYAQEYLLEPNTLEVKLEHYTAQQALD